LATWRTTDNVNNCRLEEVKEAEKESQFFTEMPNRHMFVMANLIMDVGIQDLTGADKVRTVLKDIWDIRQAKLR
jgi:GINS complex subunit 2